MLDVSGLHLYNQSSSCICILGTKSSSFSVWIGLRQDYLLSLIPFVVFMGIISRRSHGEEGVWFENVRVYALLYADDVVLLASSSHDIQRALGQFSVKWQESAPLDLRPWFSAANRWNGPFGLEGEPLSLVEQFWDLSVLFTSDLRMTWINRLGPYPQ